MKIVVDTQYIIVLKNGKIGIATTGDDHSQIIGVVSANPGFVGDASRFKLARSSFER